MKYNKLQKIPAENQKALLKGKAKKIIM